MIAQNLEFHRKMIERLKEGGTELSDRFRKLNETITLTKGIIPDHSQIIKTIESMLKNRNYSRAREDIGNLKEIIDKEITEKFFEVLSEVEIYMVNADELRNFIKNGDYLSGISSYKRIYNALNEEKKRHIFNSIKIIEERIRRYNISDNGQIKSIKDFVASQRYQSAIDGISKLKEYINIEMARIAREKLNTLKNSLTDEMVHIKKFFNDAENALNSGDVETCLSLCMRADEDIMNTRVELLMNEIELMEERLVEIESSGTDMPRARDRLRRAKDTAECGAIDLSWKFIEECKREIEKHE